MLDTTVADRFIATGQVADFREHWIFFKIFNLQNKNAFCSPSSAKAETAVRTRNELKAAYENFRPFNYGCVENLFPKFLQTAEEARIALIVGAPETYDAFVRSCEGTEYIFFDAINTAGYSAENFRSVLTHELIHIRIHGRFPAPKNESFREKLAYELFDEAFAHYFSHSENVALYDFSMEKETYYGKALSELKNAPFSGSRNEQNEFFDRGTSGKYWEKFISVAGMLYLSCHTDDFIQIFEAGPACFFEELMNLQGV